MKYLAIISLGITLLIAFCTIPPSTDKPTEVIVNDFDTCGGSYKEVLLSMNIDSLLRAIMPIECCNLRCLRMKTIFENGALGTDSLMTIFNTFFKEEKYREVISVGKDLLKKDFINLYIHDKLSAAYSRLGDTVSSLLHVSVVEKYFQSFQLLGDGLSIIKPLQAFTTEEEYQYMSMMNIKYKMQSLIEGKGRYYDKFKATTKEGKGIDLCFDISGLWYYRNKAFMKAMMNKDSTSTNKKPFIWQ